MSTDEHENRDVEEKRANEDEKVAFEDYYSRDLRIVLRNDVQGESSVSDHPRFDGFDLPIGFPLSYRTHGLRHFDYESNTPFNPNRVLVKVYARLGLHRYNLLEGTNWEFSSVKSFNIGRNSGAASYFITLYASDPSFKKIEPFHALVCEECLCRLDISVHIARPRGSVEPPPLRKPACKRSLPLPPWPSSQMITDTQHFYMLNDHELQNTEWLYVYLDLAHCTCSRGMTESRFSDFQIVQVIIQSLKNEEPPRINSKNAVVYIVYRDLVKVRRVKPSERRAIIRRRFHESTRSLKIQGKHWSPSEKKKKKRYALLNQRLGVYGAWRLRKRGFFSSGPVDQ